ncbi:hypothetical protein TNCV_437451 [Trichonephila clavipes]|nr:hypothetical protein TNCV_437451 [Trichonephila clavipes]
MGSSPTDCRLFGSTKLGFIEVTENSEFETITSYFESLKIKRWLSRLLRSLHQQLAHLKDTCLRRHHEEICKGITLPSRQVIFVAFIDPAVETDNECSGVFNYYQEYGNWNERFQFGFTSL